MEAWLAARGIPVDRVSAALRHLAFAARCPIAPWREDRGPPSIMHCPAMIAPLREASNGAIVGVHATYLTSDGRRKADLGCLPDGRPRPARKMWGRARGAACFLGDVAGPGPMAVGEGVETVLSYVAALDGPSRPVAALSLDNLQGRALRDEEGVVPLWRLRADPDSPPITVSEAGEVHILVDADMRPIEIRCQLVRRGRRERVRIDGLKRSEICAALATQAWRRAGAGPVKAFRAPAGMDFNDLGRAR
ncbi:DUF7146 domain-containing protein [Sphingomonas gellani]|uniref:DUF7146 domain-containing protein n=1 Tax=Sphingomonas gellani TaxID=1166340 RepID=UPI003CC7AE80